MNEQQKILIIEDEESIRTGLIDVFVYHGYSVHSCDNGSDGLTQALSGNFNLIILDIMLPGIDGFEICERIRQTDRSQPVIMLTAKNSEDEIIQGLKLGADDYVSKPFSVAQLVLRVEAVLRRSTSQEAPVTRIELDDNLSIDTENLSANGTHGEVTFTKKEMEVLQYLAAHSSRPVPRTELLSHVWGYGENLDIETRTVDIHIAKLRRKIEVNPKDPINLVTVRGAGYRLKVSS